MKKFLHRIPFYVSLGFKFITKNPELLPLVGASLSAFFVPPHPVLPIVIALSSLVSVVIIWRKKPVPHTSIGHTAVLDDFQADRSSVYKPSQLAAFYLRLYNRSQDHNWLIKFTPNCLSVMGSIWAWLAPLAVLVSRASNFSPYFLAYFCLAMNLFCDATDGPFAKALYNSSPLPALKRLELEKKGELFDAICDHVSLLAHLVTLTLLSGAEPELTYAYGFCYALMFATALIDTRPLRLEHIRHKFGIIFLVFLAWIPGITWVSFTYLTIGIIMSVTYFLHQVLTNS